MQKNVTDVRPGDWVALAANVVDRVREVRLCDNRTTELRFASAGTEDFDNDATVEVTSTPPILHMSWAEDSQTWVVLVETEWAGPGIGRVDVSLNDATLYDGDPEDDV